MSSKKRMTVLFGGHVQGVGFRYTTRSLAGRFDVTGYVRNLADGSVEVAAEGEGKELKAFLEAVEKSQLEPHIRSRRVSWDEAKGGFSSFEIAV